MHTGTILIGLSGLWEEDRGLGEWCDQRRHLEVVGEGMWYGYDQNIML